MEKMCDDFNMVMVLIIILIYYKIAVTDSGKLSGHICGDVMQS